MRLQSLLCSLLVAGCMATSSDQVPYRGVPGDERAIFEELEQYYADFSARDWEAFADHFWPGATLTVVWQPEGEPEPRVVVTTIPDFIRRAPDGPGAFTIFEERMGRAQLNVYGNLAQVWAEYSAKAGEPNDLQEWSGIDGITLMKHDGRWRISSIAFAADR